MGSSAHLVQVQELTDSAHQSIRSDSASPKSLSSVSSTRCFSRASDCPDFPKPECGTRCSGEVAVSLGRVPAPETAAATATQDLMAAQRLAPLILSDDERARL